MNALEEFAETIVKRVRDASIRSCDDILTWPSETNPEKRWHDALGSDNPLEFAKMLIPDIVDQTIIQLLSAIDEGSLELTFHSRQGSQLNLTREGGWLGGASLVGMDGPPSTQRKGTMMIFLMLNEENGPDSNGAKRW